MVGARAGAAQGRGERFLALDSLRGVAALCVVFYHIAAFGLIAGLPFFRQAWLMVDFFFVLSGFVIAAAYGERLAQGFSRRTFLFLRLGRLYPLHFAMVVLYIVAEFAVVRPFVGERHGIDQLLRALFMLDGFATDYDNFYSVVSWSVSAEMVAYGAAALLFGAGRKGLAVAVLLAGLAAYGLAIGMNLPVYSSFLQRCLIGFGVGVACFALYRRRPAAMSPLAASLVEGAVLMAVVAALSLSTMDDRVALLCDPLFAAVVLVFAREGGVFSRLLRMRPFLALGAWSYSIYMVHLFIIAAINRGQQFVLIRSGHTELLREADNLEGLRRIVLSPAGETLLSLATVAVVIAIASQTYRWIEQPGREWARRRARAAGAPDAERIAPTI